jgi:cellobiose-specific phosphotransferase system component IIC
MIWLIAAICALFWALGLATQIMLGGIVHVLLAASVGLVLYGAYKAGKGSDHSDETTDSLSKMSPSASRSAALVASK